MFNLAMKKFAKLMKQIVKTMRGIREFYSRMILYSPLSVSRIMVEALAWLNWSR